MKMSKNYAIENKWEYIVPLLFSFSLIFSCIIMSEKKYFWNDELLSFYLVNDYSFTNMMAALNDTINNSPPLYFVLGWLWSKIFTATELSLRLFSSLGICLAQVIVWVTLRRSYNFWSASLATLIVFTSYEIINQNSEARFYGLFIALCALGLLQYDLFCRREQDYSNLSILVNILIHTAIIQTHLYGFLYSGGLLFALIIRDLHFHIFRLRLYLSFILAWLSFVPWIPAFIRQSELAKPYSWIPIPNLINLIDSLMDSVYNGVRPVYFFSIVLIIVIVRYINKFSKKSNILNNIKNYRPEFSLLILTLIWFIVPIISWLISITVQPIFVPRYFIPTQIGWSILLATLFSLIVPQPSILTQSISKRAIYLKSLFLNKQRLTLIIITAIFIIKPIYLAHKKIPEQILSLNQAIIYEYNNLPVVIEYSHPFIKLFHYSHKRKCYFFILDWQVALDKKSGFFSPGEYKTMDALKRNYHDIFQDNIIQSQDFLNAYSTFLVLTSRDHKYKKWLEMKIKNNNKYIVKKLGNVDNNFMELFLVETKSFNKPND